MIPPESLPTSHARLARVSWISKRRASWIHRARSLVARERRRIEAALDELTGEEQAEDESQFDQTGESREAGAEVQHELVDEALAAALRDELAAVDRAEAPIAQGRYGLSVESGSPIPDDRLEAEPLAEGTVEEQSEYERSQR